MEGAEMSYWGNAYLPMVDGLVDGFARSWVEQVGDGIGHERPTCMGGDWKRTGS